MKTGEKFKARLLRTIKNLGGDVFRKNSVVMCKKTYGGYTLEKMRSIKRLIISGKGEFFYTRQCVNGVSNKDFIKL